MANRRALFLAATGFEDIEYAATRDILRRAGIETVTADCRLEPSSAPILGREKLEIVDKVLLRDVDLSAFDILVIPGGGHYQILERNPLVIAAIQYFAARADKYLCCICAAPTILGHLGLLKGRDYTCFPTMDEKAFQGRFHLDYSVIDGHLVTGQGPAASIQFGLAIVKAVLGKEACLEVGRHMFFKGIEELAGE